MGGVSLCFSYFISSPLIAAIWLPLVSKNSSRSPANLQDVAVCTRLPQA